jgi:hypothetical protein
MQSRKARESFQQFLSLLSSLEGNECEHTDALAFGGESYEDSQRGADFARGPVRRVADRSGGLQCVSGALVPQMVSCDAPQGAIHVRRQPLQCVSVSFGPGAKQLRCF